MLRNSPRRSVISGNSTASMICLGCLSFVVIFNSFSLVHAGDDLKIGMAQVEITPPLGFPISGYYSERLATGTKNPLWAKAVVFQNGDEQTAWVVCDLTGVSIDLSHEVRQRASLATGIPERHIIISGTHSHTAPDYYQALYWHLGDPDAIPSELIKARAIYAGQLIENITLSIVNAQAAAVPSTVKSGSVTQVDTVSFCRRFLMKDGSVRTWVGLLNPDALRATAPIDPLISLLEIQTKADSRTLGVLSNFALHLDTVGGLEWSADYPYYLEQSLKQALGENVISLFGTGTCGDINHADPLRKKQLHAESIGNSLGKSVIDGLGSLKPSSSQQLQIRSATVPLTLQEVSAAEVRQSVELLKTVQAGQTIPFDEHVTAYKRVVLDRLRNEQPVSESVDLISLGLSRLWQGVGERIPTEVSVITIGDDVAFVFLPGEIFVELGLAIKNASPFQTTFVVELSQSVESIYIPNRHAYEQGGYEVNNSLVQPGSGELLVDAAVRLLRECATKIQQSSN